MFTCKQVSRCLENKNYEDLSLLQKILLRLHIALCAVCGKYNTQVVQMHKLTRCFCDREDAHMQICLSEDEKAAIKQALVESKDSVQDPS